MVTPASPRCDPDEATTSVAPNSRGRNATAEPVRPASGLLRNARSCVNVCNRNRLRTNPGIHARSSTAVTACQLSPPVSCHRLSDWSDSQTVTRRNTAALHTAELQLNCELHSRRRRRNLQDLPAVSKDTTPATAETRNCTSRSCRPLQCQNAIDRASRIRLCFEFDRQLSQSITRE